MEILRRAARGVTRSRRVTGRRGRTTGAGKGSGARGSLDVSPAVRVQPESQARQGRVGRLGVALQLGPLKFCEIRANQEGSQLERTKEIKSKKDDGLFKGVTER